MSATTTPSLPPEEIIGFMHIDQTDFASFTRSQQIRHLEVEGYLVVPAGSAVLIPSLLFHGSHPNLDTEPRELIQLGYRPAWAGPIQPVEEWDPQLVAAAPEIARPFLKSLNTTGFVYEQPHKPAGMRTEAPGINPGRWGDR